MRKSVPSVLAVLGTALVLTATPLAAATATAHWSRARAVVLPAHATSIPQGYLPALACPAVNQCVAAGVYVDGALNVGGLVVAETRGVWHAGHALVPPSDAAPKVGVQPFAVTCASVGNCVIVGSYNDGAGDTLAFTAREVKGSWRHAVALALPADAASTGQVAGLRAVACVSASQCDAVGSYTTSGSSGAVEGLVATLRGSSWETHGVAAPAGANVNPLVTLTQVACARTGACVATGHYIDADNATHALVLDASGVAVASALAPPANASAFSATTVGALTCPAAGDCAATGTYETSGGQLEAYVVASTHGVWRGGEELVMPAGASVNPLAFFYGFAGLACHTPGNCVAGGQYQDAQGKTQGFLANEVRGVWQRAVTLRLPHGAQQAGRNGGVVALTCPAVGRCRAGAAFVDARGLYQALVVSEVRGHWSTTTKLALPAGANTVGVDGGVYGLICPRATRCTATGSYLDGRGDYQGFYATLG